MTALVRDNSIVFTDLDGSLLDHYSYSSEAARPALARLVEQSIPVVLCSSKTRVEIEQIRKLLGNTDPFIVENGAGIFVPEQWLDGAFSTHAQDVVLKDGYYVHASSDTRQHWLAILDGLTAQYGGEFDTFDRMGGEGIVLLTGLSNAEAALANQREFSEPVHWLGSPERRDAFIAELESHGATVSQGGRFLGVTGVCDKGRALQWLADAMRSCLGCERVDTLAIGDSGNDVPMLEVADTALLIRSPVHEFPELARSRGVLRSRLPGPEGWNEGVMTWLQERNSSC